MTKTAGHKVKTPLFKVPLWERVISDNGHFHKFTTCMELDGVGFLLHYDKEGQQFDHDWIRRHLVLRKNTWAIVEATDLQDAIHKIINEWEGCKIGGKTEESKALWINRELAILELPPCGSYWIREPQGNVTCGKPTECGGAGCIFDGFDPIDDCPGDIFCKKISHEYDKEKREWVAKVNPNSVTIDGLDYKFITWRSI